MAQRTSAAMLPALERSGQGLRRAEGLPTKTCTSGPLSAWETWYASALRWTCSDIDDIPLGFAWECWRNEPAIPTYVIAVCVRRGAPSTRRRSVAPFLGAAIESQQHPSRAGCDAQGRRGYLPHAGSKPRRSATDPLASRFLAASSRS